jgi:hypothetical protein
MTDQPREQSRSGCGGALAWFVTVGLIRAIGQQLGWSTRAQLIAVVVTLVLGCDRHGRTPTSREAGPRPPPP